MNKIFFELYNPTGMINQVMSLELAVGIAHQTGAQLVVHHAVNNGDSLFNYKKVPIYTPSRFYNKQRIGFTEQDQFPHLLDIMDFDANLIIIDEKIEHFPQETECITNMMGEYYYSNTDFLTDDELAFADGRQKLDLRDSIHLKNTLGFYSRFFYNRNDSLNTTLAKVKFKTEYFEFAKMVSKSIGDFVGAHLRLSDHVRMFNTTEDMFVYGLEKLAQENKQIILCTDEPSHLMVQKHKHKFLLLDEYITNNFRSEFKSLKFRDEVIFGLICNIVMQESVKFIGTSGSTYTAYIHRMRNMSKLGETWDFFDNPVPADGKPYSWNANIFPKSGQKMWWREWPESSLL